MCISGYDANPTSIRLQFSIARDVFSDASSSAHLGPPIRCSPYFRAVGTVQRNPLVFDAASSASLSTLSADTTRMWQLSFHFILLYSIVDRDLGSFLESTAEGLIFGLSALRPYAEDMYRKIEEHPAFLYLSSQDYEVSTLESRCKPRH